MTTREEWPVDRLLFPALCLARDTSVAVAESPDGLRRCNARAFFRNQYFDDLIIFDSRAAQFRVTSAAPAEPMTGMKKLLLRVLNGRLTVQLSVGREAEASLDAAKAHVVAWLRKNPDFWEASREMSEWEQMVNAAPDMRRLIRLFV
jgi:hypothetical protein